MPADNDKRPSGSAEPAEPAPRTPPPAGTRRSAPARVLAAWVGFWVHDRQPGKRYVTGPGAGLLALLLVLIGVVVMANIVGAWPSAVPPTVAEVMEDASDTMTVLELQAFADSVRTAATAADTVRVYAVVTTLRLPDVSWDFRLLLISLWFGALGSLLHAAASFVQFAGNRNLVSSWLPWYIIRPVLGAGLAAVFYVVVRAGLVTTGGAPLADVSHFPIAASAALVGLFTQRATKKLADVFDALFTPSAGAEDADALSHADPSALPKITSIKPQLLKVGDSDKRVRVEAEGLATDVKLRVNGEEAEFERESDGSLVFTPKPDAVATKGTIEVTLHTEAGVSAPRRIVVTP